MANSTLIHGDCLQVLRTIPPASVDMILTDLPYGVTGNSWDSALPYSEMWSCVNRVIRERSAIVLFGTQPFSSMLLASNVSHFKHEWIWQKEKGVGFQIAKVRPMQEHEHILVFSKDGKSVNYYPIKKKRDTILKSKGASSFSATCPVRHLSEQSYSYTDSYPTSIIKFSRDADKLHPTQKPIALLEYLIKTYTQEGQTVLDFTCGSGSTGVACMRSGRDFIGIELDDNYFSIASQRIEDAKHHIYSVKNAEAERKQLSLFE